MLKEAVIDYVQGFISDYFETLDTSQLTISLWAGDVTLHELIVKTTAIETILGLPIQVQAGKVGKLCMKIPWATLFRSPVEVTIHDLYVLLTPSYSVYDKETEEMIALLLKKNVIQKFEDSYREYAIRKSGESLDLSYKGKFAMRVVNNIQIKLQSIHIRYEDNITQPFPFSVGFLLKSLIIQTTDEAWTPTFVSQSLDTWYKLATLEGLAIYWNINTKLMSSVSMTKEMLLQKLKEFVDGNGNGVRMNHVIGPVQAELKLMLTPDPAKTNFQLPQQSILLVFTSLALELNQNQFKDALKMAETVEFIARSYHFKKYKPTNLNQYKDEYKAWWKFAYDCVLEDVRRRHNNWNWSYIQKHRKLVKSYTEVYYNKTISRNPGKDLLEEVNRLEKSLDVFNIILARKLVQIRLKRQETIEASRKPGWILSWFVKSRLSAEELKKVLSDDWTPEEKSQLTEVLQYNQQPEPVVMYPTDYQVLKLQFRIEYMTFTLSELDTTAGATGPAPPSRRRTTASIARPSIRSYNDHDVIVQLEILKLEVQASRRPVNNGLTLGVTLGSVEARGVENKQYIISDCIHGRRVSQLPTVNLFEFSYENQPLDSTVDRRIKVIAQPLQLTYHYHTIQKLVDLFILDTQIELQELNAVAASKLEELKEFSSAKFHQILESRAETDLSVYFLAPLILIPQDGELKRGHKSVLGIDLGKLLVRSESRSFKLEEILEENAFDTYTVELKDFKVFLAHPHENYDNKSLQKATHLLNYDAMVVLIKHYLIRQNSSSLPLLKIEVNLPTLNGFIAKRRFFQLIQLVVTLPIPHTDAPVKSSTPSHSVLYSEKKAISRLPYLNLKTAYSQMSTSREMDVVQSMTLILDARVNSVKIRLNQEKKKLLTFEIKNLLLLTMIKSCFHEVNVTAQSVTLSILGHRIPGRMGSVYLIYAANKAGIEEPVATVDMVLYCRRRVTKSHSLESTKACPKKFAPLFSTSVSINFTSLYLTLHQEALSTIVSFLNGFMHVRPNTAKAGQLPKIKTLLTSKKKSKIRVGAIIQTITLHLASDTKNISKFVLKRLYGSYEHSSIEGNLVVCLDEMVGYPIQSFIPYFKILVVEGKYVFKSSLVFNYDDEVRRSRGHDVAINAVTGSLFAIILPRYILDMKEFLGTILSLEEHLLPGSSSHDFWRSVYRIETPTVVDDTARKKILVDIKVEAPRFVFPRTESSSDAIMVNLGELSFANKFIPLPTDSKKPVILDEIRFLLEAARISRISLNFTTQAISAEVYLMSPISLECKVRRNLTPWQTSIPNVHLTVLLEVNILRMDLGDYKLCSSILRQVLSPVAGQQQRHAERVEKAGKPSKYLPASTATEDLVLEVLLQKLDVFLYKETLSLSDRQGVVIRDPEKALAHISLSDIRGTCHTWTNGDISALLVLGDLTLEDIRTNPENAEDERKNILVRKPGNKPEAASSSLSAGADPFLKLSYTNGTIRDVSQANTNLELPALSVNMYSEFIVELLKFFTSNNANS